MPWKHLPAKKACFPRDSYIYMVEVAGLTVLSVTRSVLRRIAMLSNFWKGLSFYCVNCHEQPVKMVYKEGGSLFLACPKYMLAGSRYPDGHERNEAACPNRLSYSDAEKIVSMLSDSVQESLAQDDFCDFTGYRFKMRQVSVEVLHYTDGDIRLGILNRGTL